MGTEAETPHEVLGTGAARWETRTPHEASGAGAVRTEVAGHSTLLTAASDKTVDGNTYRETCSDRTRFGSSDAFARQ